MGGGGERDWEKDVAFYSATVNAWYTTRFEKDKHLLSLSLAGIGFLVTLATAVGASSRFVGASYLLAGFSFLICIVVILRIFDRNADYIQDLLADGDDNARDKKAAKTAETERRLNRLDDIAVAAFVLGVVFTLLVGTLSGIDNFQKREADMARDTKQNLSTGTNEDSTKVPISKSISGAGGLRPSPKPKPSSGGQGDQTGPASKDQSGNASKDKK